jgi:integrase
MGHFDYALMFKNGGRLYDRNEKLPGSATVREHKTKNGEQRAVPLTSIAIATLDSLPASIKGREIPLEKMTLYRAFKSACDRAGIKDYTWHDLRHESLSRLAE